MNLAIEARSTTLNQGHVCCQAHFVDMPPCIKIVQCIEDDIEALKPFYIELRVLDVGMVRLELNMRIEFCCALFGNLGEEVNIDDPNDRMRSPTIALDFLMCS